MPNGMQKKANRRMASIVAKMSDVELLTKYANACREQNSCNSVSIRIRIAVEREANRRKLLLPTVK